MTSRSFSVNCEWSAWEQPPCSATCGHSVFITKTRRKKFEASDGGLDCEGKSEIKEQCNIPECKIVLQEVIKGRLPLSSTLNKKGNLNNVLNVNLFAFFCKNIFLQSLLPAHGRNGKSFLVQLHAGCLRSGKRRGIK